MSLGHLDIPLPFSLRQRTAATHSSNVSMAVNAGATIHTINGLVMTATPRNAPPSQGTPPWEAAAAAASSSHASSSNGHSAAAGDATQHHAAPAGSSSSGGGGGGCPMGHKAARISSSGIAHQVGATVAAGDVSISLGAGTSGKGGVSISMGGAQEAKEVKAGAAPQGVAD